MDRKYKSGASATPPSVPASPSTGYPTGGDPLVPTPATIPGPYWYYMMTEEMRKVIADAGLTPDHTNIGQLSQAIQALIAGSAPDFIARYTTTGNVALTGLGTQAGGDWPGAMTAGDIVFAKGQTTGSQNGWYTVAAGAWTRCTFADVSAEVKPGSLTKVTEGTALADTIWMLTTDAPITLGTTALVFGRKDGSVNTLVSMAFNKADTFSPAFTKTGAATLSINAGTSLMVASVSLSWSANTALTMPALTAGNDYAIYACADGTIRADASFTAPAGYTVNNSRMIGGFHYGLVAAGTTVAGGSFATTGSGMIWTQPDVDNIAGINKFSIWDLKFRPACSSPRGMVLVNGRTWVDIYLCSTDTAANGTSKYNTNIASGTVLPKIPAAFGGNGTTTYAAGDWWSFNEIARANGKRLMLASEFYDAAFGVTESQSIDATASTYPTTLRNAGYTSKYGIEQASGHHYTWGMDAAGSASAWVANGGRGQSCNNSIVRVLLGGARTSGASSGSRCANFINVTWLSSWNVGLRAACDHMQLV